MYFIEPDGSITEERARYEDCHAGLTSGGRIIVDPRVGRADMPKKFLHGLQLIEPGSVERLYTLFHHAKL